jgi:hypothetical protein
MNFKKIITSLLVSLPIATGALNAGSIYWPEELRKIEQSIFGNNCSLPIDIIRTVRIGYKTFTVKAKQRVKRIDVGCASYYFKAERTIKIYEKNIVHRSTVISKTFYEQVMTEAKANMMIAGGLCTLIGGAMLLLADAM